LTFICVLCCAAPSVVRVLFFFLSCLLVFCPLCACNSHDQSARLHTIADVVTTKSHD
jgi:hypothetical protein